MAENKGPLGLAIPSQIYPSGSAFYTDPKKVQQWIEALPRAHVGETSRLVYNALRELNQLQLRAETRFEILEVLTEATHYVVTCLRKHILGRAFPLSPKQQKVAYLIKEILREAATGYKVVLENLLSGSAASADSRMILASCYRAIQYEHALLLNAYQTYSPHPENTWLEIHKLYRFAYGSSLQDLIIKDLSHVQDVATVDHIYKQALLLSLVNPYQLAQDDIQRIHDSLPYWAPFCQLTPTGFGPNPPGLFAVDLDRDEPPTYHAHCNVLGNSCLVLDTHQLTQQLRDLLGTRGQPGPGYPATVQNLSKDTLKRMLLSWGLLSKRNFPRRGNSAQVDITLGLSATVKYLQGARGQPAATGTRAATFSSQPLANADGTGLYPEMWDLNGTTSVSSIYQRKTERSRLTVTHPAGAREADRPQRFNVTNESAGGYCLLWKQSLSGALVVGDLVCMHQPEGRCNICVVRWMKSFGDRMVLGIEILSPCAEPVSIRLNNGSGPRAELTDGLLLPPVTAVRRPVTLITSSLYRSGDILSLDTPGGNRLVQLTYLQQVTRSFRQFQFEEFNSQGTNVDETPGFDSIWLSL